MLKIGETVRYGQSGLCTVQEKCEKEIGGVCQEYYVLSPILKRGSVVFVPCSNTALLEKITRPLTAEEIEVLIEKVLATPTEWIRNFRRRSETFKKALASSDRKEPFLVIKTIYDYRKENASAPLRVHTTDDYFLRDAENLVYSEIAYVQDRTYEEVAAQMREIFFPQTTEE